MVCQEFQAYVEAGDALDVLRGDTSCYNDRKASQETCSVPTARNGPPAESVYNGFLAIVLLGPGYPRPQEPKNLA